MLSEHCTLGQGAAVRAASPHVAPGGVCLDALMEPPGDLPHGLTSATWRDSFFVDEDIGSLQIDALARLHMPVRRVA